jgi:hypothetical protein
LVDQLEPGDARSDESLPRSDLANRAPTGAQKA